MHIIFSDAADGLIHPDFPGSSDGALNWPVVGPAGLIDILETKLGLGGPTVSETVRIAAYARKLASTPATASFWRPSFEKDAWGTARQLLQLRDELVSGGWKGEELGSLRLNELATVELSGPQLPGGLADRLMVILDKLAPGAALDVDSIDHRQPLSRLAVPWRRLLSALETSGVKLIDASARPTAPEGSDLRKVQVFLADGIIAPLHGDGSFGFIEADTALMASESLAEWIAAGDATEMRSTLVLAPDGDTSLLDHALRARGLPALGTSSASPWRGALQILPLAFATAWRPFNAKALLDLLSLPRPPIGRFAASKLARVLVEKPGLGSADWHEAWIEIEERLRTKAETDGSLDKVPQRLEAWKAWTESGLYDRAAGMTTPQARAIANRVSAWALEMDRGQGDPLLMALASAATVFCDAIDAIGMDPLPALLVDKILAQALASGATNPAHVPEAGTLRAVTAPSGLWGTAERLVWWPFIGPGERIAAPLWDRAEQAALVDAGIELEATSATTQRVSGAYVDAALRTRSQLILVRPALSGSEATVGHPLAHQLDPLTRPAKNKISWKAEDLLAKSSVAVAQRTIARNEVAVSDTPAPTAIWALPATLIERIKGREESATSLDHLIQCQLRWVIEDILRLRTGRLFQIPGPSQLFGNLAHEIARALFVPGAPPRPDEVAGAASQLFDQLLPTIASPLQQPEHASELAAARIRVPAALTDLAARLHERKLSVVGAELERNGVKRGPMTLQGRFDLVVATAAGDRGVIDLKWTKSVNSYRSHIKDGRAIQLAVYSAIVDEASETRAPAAYYLLNQRLLLAERGSPLTTEGMETSRSLSETFDAIDEAWRAWTSLAETGSALAMGLAAAKAAAPQGLQLGPVKDPCTFCDYQGLCAVKVEAI